LQSESKNSIIKLLQAPLLFERTVMAALKPVTFLDLIDAIATLPIINLPENLSQLSSNKSQFNCNKGRGLRHPRRSAPQVAHQAIKAFRQT
jgi:hypothetical protein